MSTLDTLLNQIARETLRLETLETRKSDSLDFHDLPVWMLREALKAAFEAGAQHAKPRNTARRSP